MATLFRSDKGIRKAMYFLVLYFLSGELMYVGHLVSCTSAHPGNATETILSSFFCFVVDDIR